MSSMSYVEVIWFSVCRCNFGAFCRSWLRLCFGVSRQTSTLSFRRSVKSLFTLSCRQSSRKCIVASSIKLSSSWSRLHLQHRSLSYKHLIFIHQFILSSLCF